MEIGDVEYLRTPAERFEGLPGYPFEAHHARVPGDLRMHYVDEGPAGAPVVVLLHGEPSWSFLYRKMIPILVDAGLRVVAPDLVGFGKSDKPVDRDDHTYARHVEWTRSLLFGHLDLEDVTLFGQDWGGLIGLRLVADHPERFSRVAVGNTGLPTGETTPSEAFLEWREASQSMPRFPAGQVVQGGTVTTLPPEVVAAYDAPFPDSSYQAGARILPVLVPVAPDDPGAARNRAAWERLREWERPFLTLFSDSDPVTRSGATRFREEIPGAAGQPHRTISDAGHFLQEDRGEELARLLVDFIERTGA